MTDVFEQSVLPLFEQTRRPWLDQARAVALALGELGDVTIDDVRERCPPPSNVDPRVMGAVFKKPDWECVGYQKSKRQVNHNRPIGVFRRRK